MSKPETPATQPARLEDFEPVDDPSRVPELEVQLGEASEADDEPPARADRPDTEALSDAQIDAILGRMQSIDVQKGDQKDFAKREDSLPPPKTGDVIEASFPPEGEMRRPDSVAVDPDQKLEVLRFAPDGEVPLAPHVSVTFNLPMVEVTSHDDTVAAGVPVKLTPQPEGSWRWVGAKTALFGASGERLPMATEYTVEIPEGTKAATGQELGEDRKWSFKTPAVNLEQSWPNHGTHGRNPLMFMKFDQRIEPDEIIESVEVSTGKLFGGGRSVKLVDAAQVEALREEGELDAQIARMIEQAPEGRWIAFRATKQLPHDANVKVTLEEGAPSAEGPRRTESDQSFSFRTYGPFKVTENRCGGHRGCSPNDQFWFRFSNQLEPEQDLEELISVEPEFGGMQVRAYGNNVYVSGYKPGRRSYEVTFSEEVLDEFGQTLGGKRSYEFEVGSGWPSLAAAGGPMMVLDPAMPPRLSMVSVNYTELKVKAYKVQPKDWPAYLDYYRDWQYYGKHKATPPGKLVMDETISVEAAPDEPARPTVELDDPLGGDTGHLVLVIEPGGIVDGAPAPRRMPVIRRWVQATDIGLDAFVDATEMSAWVTDLETGEPLEGVELSLSHASSTPKTDAEGMAHFELPKSPSDDEPGMLRATRGDDQAFLPREAISYRRGVSWFQRTLTDHLTWYVIDDRQMYKPGETVRVKGWLRMTEAGEQGGLKLAEELRGIEYRVIGAQGNEITSGDSQASALGGFDLSFDLPGTANLGSARVELKAPSVGPNAHHHTFQIQEFRRPEFEVSAQSGEGPYFAGGDATASVEAKYYAGGALPNADLTWRVTTQAGNFRPPNNDDFTFGTWTPWWARAAHTGGGSTAETYQAQTDVMGRHELGLKLGDIDPPRPMTVKAEATVMDVNRQAWSSATNLLVHPSEYYVGLRTERYFVERGEPLEVELVVADLDGERYTDRPVKVRAARVEWDYKGGSYREKLVDPQSCDVVNDEEIFTCTFETDIGGRYKIMATTVDDHGRRNYSELTRWVSGAGRPTAKNVEQEEVTLVPDSDDYQPEETAEILVQAPFAPAEGLLTIRRQGIVEEKRFAMEEATTTLKIPIKHTHVPNVYVQVDLVGETARLDEEGQPDDSLPTRPAYAKGTINLKVPPTQRVLSLDLEPAAERVSPGQKTSVDVRVTDANDQPVEDAEVALIVVDEAILALSSYALKDPIDVFYGLRPAGARDYHLRQYITLAEAAELRELAEAERAEQPTGAVRQRAMKSAPAPSSAAEAAPMAMDMVVDEEMAAGGAVSRGDGGSAAQPAIAVRSNFDPLAAFAPAVSTDTDGKATLEVEMPDNLTRYRIMAVAVHDDDRFGSAEDNVTARLPLMVRPSAPRFLNFGDRFELPVVLQNQTDDVMQVDVATRAANIGYTGSRGWRVSVPANDRVEVRFAAETDQVGTARFQVGATSEAGADASEFSLPVWTPATSEAFATYGTIDDGSIAQPVALPGEVFTQFGGVEVTTSSTALQELTDAFLYIYDYDYQCTEQIASRMITIAALRDVLQAFEAEGMPAADEVEASMTRDIDELAAKQNHDGGFGFWRRGQRSWPFVSLHAAHALVRADAKGYEVPAHVLQRAKNHLQRIESYIPHWYSERTRRFVIAYSLYVRNLMGDRDVAKAKALLKRAGGPDGLAFEAVGWLLGVMTGQQGTQQEVATLRRYLANRVTETAAGAHFATNTTDQDYVILHSNRRADGVVLEALIDDQPDSDLIAKIVRGLLAHRTKGRWSNTQENAFILLALDKYFNKYEKVTPDFVARAWLGDRYAGEHAFKGRTVEQHRVDIPLTYLDADEPSNLYLQKDGEGRMYYRIGMDYAPKSLELEPSDHGFVVERTYEGVDNPDDVTRADDGTWKIKAGAKVRIELTMVAPTRRYHVALVDPLPAGLEALNPALATTGDLPEDAGASNQTSGGGAHRIWWWWTRPWFEHQNMRDERVEAFSSLLWGGVHTYTYYARATTPGQFVVPPAKAEEMYHPETFGRSATERVDVVD